jgi:sn-glycerol 3-phosphate transport system substrate-binding protein
MTRAFSLLLISILLSVGSVAAAQTTITFWHSMEGAVEAVDALAAAFNERQGEYRVEPQYVGSYTEAQTRLVAALGTPNEPALFQSEIALFPRLVADGAVQPLDDLVATLDEAFIADFYPGLWHYGEIDGQRYGLPWNSSTPVLFYNASVFRQRNIPVPTTWEEFEQAAEALTSRQSQGFLAIGESWLFEMMVTTRGGSLVTEDGQPNFTSPEAVDALRMLERLVERRHAAAYASGEVTMAMVSFIRTRTLMAFASIANWPDVKRFSVAFDIAAAPVPTGGSNTVPLGGAQLVIMRNATSEQREGAFVFWQFLMEPENLASWIRASFYIPVRRAALPLLEPWYAEDPHRRAALSQLEHAVPRPRNPAFNTWRTYLDEALERALKGNATPEDALAEAQRRALEDLR